jgi:hypothetical protein
MIAATIQTLREEIPLHMSSAESDALKELLDSAKFYLEWGAGGSTLAAVRSKVHSIVSVESDPAWIEKVKQHPEVTAAIGASRLVFRHVDLGPVGPWGVPTGDTKIRNWPQYVTVPFIRSDFDFDLVLVDGRFRLHCLLAVANCVGEGARIFLHDYAFRHSYTVADKYFDTIKQVGSAVVLKRRHGVNYRALYLDLIASLFDV